jgi:hypothetical protein
MISRSRMDPILVDSGGSFADKYIEVDVGNIR